MIATTTAGGPSEPEAIIERRGAAGLVILNRPRALNALTHAMTHAIAWALDDWEHDERIERVVFAGAGDRAFCAGGDVRALYGLGLAGDHARQLAFWRDEYRLDWRVKRYSKPIWALVDGLVMGGGVGLALHASRRVATERAHFAMPEVGIGFFPDVGATYVLSRLPGRLGAYLVATGLGVDAGDMAAVGLVDAFAPRERLSGLLEDLTKPDGETRASAAFAAAPPANLLNDKAMIAEAFSALDRRRALAALARERAPAAAAALEAMREKCPMSQEIALRQVASAAVMTFEDVLRQDYRIVWRICRADNFLEGVRAAIIDKDRRPRWRPAFDEEIDPAELDAYFSPLGGDELKFQNGAS